MKIGFDAKRLFRNYTGLGNYSRTLVGNLRAEYPANEYFLLTEKVTINDQTEEFTPEKYTIITPGGSKFLWRTQRCVKDIERYKLDIYHGLSHDLPRGIEKSGARSVVTIHDVCYKTFPAMFPLVERLLYAKKYGHSLSKADRVIAISQSTKDDILRFFPSVDPSKVEVIYQALNPVFYNAADRDEARKVVAKYGVGGDFVLFVGAVNLRKNLIGVLRAYASIHAQQRVPLVVIGNGSGKYMEQCRRAIIDLGLEDDVVHIENLSSMHVLRDFYTLAKCLIYPSFYEGFGLPVAEAQLCGCPVITSQVSSLPEAGGPNAFYVSPDDVSDIASKITTLLAMDDSQRVEIGAQGHRWVAERFDPARLTAQVEALYRTLG